MGYNYEDSIISVTLKCRRIVCLFGMLCLCALFQSSCRAAKLINKYLILSYLLLSPSSPPILQTYHSPRQLFLPISNLHSSQLEEWCGVHAIVEHVVLAERAWRKSCSELIAIKFSPTTNEPGDENWEPGQSEWQDAGHRSVIGYWRWIDHETIDQAVWPRDDHVQDASVCMCRLVHMLYQPERIQQESKLGCGRIRRILEMYIQVSGNDQLRMISCELKVATVSRRSPKSLKNVESGSTEPGLYIATMVTGPPEVLSDTVRSSKDVGLTMMSNDFTTKCSRKYRMMPPPWCPDGSGDPGGWARGASTIRYPGGIERRTLTSSWEMCQVSVMTVRSSSPSVRNSETDENLFPSERML